LYISDHITISLQIGLA